MGDNLIKSMNILNKALSVYICAHACVCLVVVRDGQP